MNPLVIFSAVLAVASAAPGNYLAPKTAVVTGATLPLAPLAKAALPPVVGAAPLPQFVPKQPVISLPAPYTTSAIQGADVTTINKPPAIVSKKLNYGATTFVSGYDSVIRKPATPHLNIAVSRVLKGTAGVNPTLVDTVKERHEKNEYFNVEKRVQVPIDVPVYRQEVTEVGVPTPRVRPVPVPHPVAVPGEPIVNVRQGKPIVQHTHTQVNTVPVATHQTVGIAGYTAAADLGAYGYALPAAHADINAYGYALPAHADINAYAGLDLAAHYNQGYALPGYTRLATAGYGLALPAEVKAATTVVAKDY